MAPISGHKGLIEICGTSTAMTTEAFTVIAGTGNENWRITAAAKNVFDWTVVHVVEAEDGTWNTLGAEEYKLRFTTGTVEIDAYTSGSGTVTNITAVRITGYYLPKFPMVEARDSSGELITAMLNASVFGNDGERRIPGRQDANLSFTVLEPGNVKLDNDGVFAGPFVEETLWELIEAGTAVIASVTPNRDVLTNAIRVLVIIERSGLSLPGGDVLSSSISMVGSVQDAAMATQSVRIWDLLN